MELPGLSKFLVPVDGSEASRRAKRYAMSLAKKCGATVVLFHAHAPVANTIGGESRKKVVEQDLANIEKVFDIYKDGFDELGVQYETQIEFGSPAKMIMKSACELGCDMIIMGAKGQKGLSKVLGTEASKVSSLSPIPVLIVGTECDCTNSCGQECLWKWRFEPVANLAGVKTK